MNLIVNIRPEVREELGRQAAAQGVESASMQPIARRGRSSFAGPKKLTVEQLDKALEEIAQFSGKIPSLPDEAFSRENLYRDHD